MNTVFSSLCSFHWHLAPTFKKTLPYRFVVTLYEQMFHSRHNL